MFFERKSVTITTDVAGDATAYIDVQHGFIHALHYIKTDFADGVDFTITSEVTGETIWTELNVNAADVIYPRVPTSTPANVAILYAATFAVNDKIALANDRIKIVIANGGDTKTGEIIALIG